MGCIFVFPMILTREIISCWGHLLTCCYVVPLIPPIQKTFFLHFNPVGIIYTSHYQNDSLWRWKKRKPLQKVDFDSSDGAYWYNDSMSATKKSFKINTACKKVFNSCQKWTSKNLFVLFCLNNFKNSAFFVLTVARSLRW